MVTDKDVAIITREYLTHWESLVPHLGLMRTDEVDIGKTNTNYGMQKTECLQKWKQRMGDKATYGALITAATEAKDQQLADRVKNMIRSRTVMSNGLKQNGDLQANGKGVREMH